MLITLFKVVKTAHQISFATHVENVKIAKEAIVVSRDIYRTIWCVSRHAMYVRMKSSRNTRFVITVVTDVQSVHCVHKTVLWGRHVLMVVVEGANSFSKAWILSKIFVVGWSTLNTRAWLLLLTIAKLLIATSFWTTVLKMGCFPKSFMQDQK